MRRAPEAIQQIPPSQSNAQHHCSLNPERETTKPGALPSAKRFQLPLLAEVLAPLHLKTVMLRAPALGGAVRVGPTEGWVGPETQVLELPEAQGMAEACLHLPTPVTDTRGRWWGDYFRPCSPGASREPLDHAPERLGVMLGVL